MSFVVNQQGSFDPYYEEGRDDDISDRLRGAAAEQVAALKEAGYDALQETSDALYYLIELAEDALEYLHRDREEPGQYVVTLSGHVNPGLVNREEWANDYLQLTISRQGGPEDAATLTRRRRGVGQPVMVNGEFQVA